MVVDTQNFQYGLPHVNRVILACWFRAMVLRGSIEFGRNRSWPMLSEGTTAKPNSAGYGASADAQRLVLVVVADAQLRERAFRLAERPPAE